MTTLSQTPLAETLPMHGDLKVSTLAETLTGRHIIVGVGGGIAAIESPRVIRALRRLGARVTVFATENALHFVGLTALEWASAETVSVKPSGLAEHIAEADAILVTPATADLIAQAATGLCSDGLSTLLQSAFGKRCPVLFAPSMHLSMATSPLVARNVESLQALSNVQFVQPLVAEGKWKAREPEVIADELSHFLWSKTAWAGQSPSALVTLGGTRVPIDAVRSLANLSTGSLGSLIVRELYRHGVRVTACICSATNTPPALDGLTVHDTATFEALQGFLRQVDPAAHNALFMTAAVSDFAPAGSHACEKIPSSTPELILKLTRTDKLVTLPNVLQIPWRFVCKLTSDRSREQAQRFEDLLNSTAAHAAFWNTAAEAFTNSGPDSLTEHPPATIGQFHLPDERGPGPGTACTTRHQVAQLAVKAFLQAGQEPR